MKVNVRVQTRGTTWHRHIEQQRPRYGVEEDVHPGEAPTLLTQDRDNKRKQEKDFSLRQIEVEPKITNND